MALFANKILTWDNCLKHGWTGPSICYLCKDESEMVSHIFLSCSYTGHVWTLIVPELKTLAIWCSKSLEQSFHNWEADRELKGYAYFSCLMVTGIWWVHNQAIFYDYMKTLEVTMRIINWWLVEFKEDIKPPRIFSLMPLYIDLSIPWGYFDRVSQGTTPPRHGHWCSPFLRP